MGGKIERNAADIEVGKGLPGSNTYEGLGNRNRNFTIHVRQLKSWKNLPQRLPEDLLYLTGLQDIKTSAPFLAVATFLAAGNTFHRGDNNAVTFPNGRPFLPI